MPKMLCWGFFGAEKPYAVHLWPHNVYRPTLKSPAEIIAHSQVPPITRSVWLWRRMDGHGMSLLVSGNDLNLAKRLWCKERDALKDFSPDQIGEMINGQE